MYSTRFYSAFRVAALNNFGIPYFSNVCALSTSSISNQLKKSLSVTYHEYGDPVKVLQLTESDVPELGSEDVRVKMMAAPINPADINTIQGVYPVKQDLPTIGGNEGVGMVIDVGSDVSVFDIGDWVIPSRAVNYNFGTWSNIVTTNYRSLMTIPKDISLENAATFSVNPCTAYRLLSDFGDLQAGDVVLQNGANSGVGLAVIQIAAARGIDTVNLVRERASPNENDKLVSYLVDLGATHVITVKEDGRYEPCLKTTMKSISKPKLALNCVGGKSTAELLKYISKGGCMVTYGGMSKRPMLVQAGPLIFNDVSLRGFWMTQWNSDNSHGSAERQHMITYLTDLMQLRKLLPPPAALVPITSFRDAIFESMQPYVSRKQILIMNNDS